MWKHAEKAIDMQMAVCSENQPADCAERELGLSKKFNQNFVQKDTEFGTTQTLDILN